MHTRAVTRRPPAPCYMYPCRPSRVREFRIHDSLIPSMYFTPAVRTRLLIISAQPDDAYPSSPHTTPIGIFKCARRLRFHRRCLIHPLKNYFPAVRTTLCLLIISAQRRIPIQPAYQYVRRHFNMVRAHAARQFHGRCPHSSTQKKKCNTIRIFTAVTASSAGDRRSGLQIGGAVR
ncbi:hypothetical protein B0H17DRAFT_230661 [Mycena rosella]|uniref:Uncharacterized protein n=1 Tax=Mycena rosella TaxID=1033263 RepID=A0AAD7H169_MYCRO|nr:hypothetical protein B0H17DRAFT_230661 [Mycena rosella]